MPFKKPASIYRTLIAAIAIFGINGLTQAEFKLSPIDSFHQTDGWGPLTTPSQSSGGIIFGVAPYGGDFGTYAGVIYTIDPSNGFRKNVIHHMNPSTDGALPESTLVERDKSGEMYGVTYLGGTNDCGTVFKINASGNFSVVKNLEQATGCHPIGRLTFDLDGVLYGTAYDGGSNALGTLFRLDTKNGDLSALHHFGGFIGKKMRRDGYYPVAGVSIFNAATLYGVTSWGGDGNVGVLYSYDVNSGKYEILHSFDEVTTGKSPIGTPMVDKSRKTVYGTSRNGGAKVPARGTIWIYYIKENQLRVIHEFNGIDDGEEPYAELTMGKNGQIFGTTSLGGRYGAGTAFLLDVSQSPTGTYQKVADFKMTDGQTKIGRHPFGGLMMFKNNYFIGTLHEGGDAEFGAIYRLRESPVSAKEGATKGNHWSVDPSR